METKKLIIICLLVVAVVIAICGIIIYSDSFKDTNLSLKENSVYKNKNIHFVLTDVDGNPLDNKNITINITSSKNKTNSYNITTDEKGVANLKIKLSKGNYVVNASFNGENFFKASNLTNKKLKVKVKEKSKVETPSYTILQKRDVWDDGSPCTDEVYAIRLANGEEACLYNGKIVPFSQFM